MVHVTAIAAALATYVVVVLAGFATHTRFAGQACRTKYAPSTHDERVYRARTRIGSAAMALGLVVGVALLLYLTLRSGVKKSIQNVALSVLLGYFVTVISYNCAVSSRVNARLGYFYDPSAGKLDATHHRDLTNRAQRFEPVNLLGSAWYLNGEDSSFALCTTTYVRATAWRTYAAAAMLAVLVGGVTAVYITQYPAERSQPDEFDNI